MSVICQIQQPNQIYSVTK